MEPATLADQSALPDSPGLAIHHRPPPEESASKLPRFASWTGVPQGGGKWKKELPEDKIKKGLELEVVPPAEDIFRIAREKCCPAQHQGKGQGRPHFRDKITPRYEEHLRGSARS